MKESRLAEVEWQDNWFRKVCKETYVADMLPFMSAYLGCMKTVLR